MEIAVNAGVSIGLQKVSGIASRARDVPIRICGRQGPRTNDTAIRNTFERKGIITCEAVIHVNT